MDVTAVNTCMEAGIETIRALIRAHLRILKGIVSAEQRRKEDAERAARKKN
jgi:predicted RecB family nuclease